MSDILIITHDQDCIKQLSRMLKSMEVEFSARLSSLDALAEIESKSTLRYSAIIIDLIMPDVDGYMILALLQQKNIKIPTIVITKQSASHEINTALRLGAWDIITRPFSNERTQLTIRNAIRYSLQLETLNAINLKSNVNILNENGRIHKFEDIEKQIYNFVHKHTDGHISQMSRELKIGRSTLYRKLKKYGLHVQ